MTGEVTIRRTVLGARWRGGLTSQSVDCLLRETGTWCIGIGLEQLLVVGVAGFAAKVIELVGTEGSASLTPLDAPGLWLAAVAFALMTWGVLEILAERTDDRL